MAGVLLVDDEPDNLELLRAFLAPEGFTLLFAGDGEAALRAVRDHRPDVIVLDLMMPRMDGFEVLRQLKADESTADIPVLVVTARGDNPTRARAAQLGAEDFVTKPADRLELRIRVGTWLRLKHHMDQLERMEDVLMSLALTVEARDPSLRDHCQRIARTVDALGRSFGLDDQQRRVLRLGAYLHDVGKIGIPDAVLLKPGPLSPEETVVMQAHTRIGDEILCPLKTLDAARPLVRHHHERLNGTGYPDGLRGEQIPLAVRILSVADVYDTLTNNRCYRTAMAPARALAVIAEEVERGYWDPEVLARLEAITVGSAT